MYSSPCRPSKPKPPYAEGFKGTVAVVEPPLKPENWIGFIVGWAILLATIAAIVFAPGRKQSEIIVTTNTVNITNFNK